MLFSYFPALVALCSTVSALGGLQNIVFKNSKDDLQLAAHKKSATLFLDTEDWPGVVRAGLDLSDDFKKVTGEALPVVNFTGSGICTKVHGKVESAIIIGTVGNSSIIDTLVSAKKLDVSEIEGKWESYVMKVIENPAPCISSALVIAGSDKRGSIFGAYDISEQIGVSPWYWFADVVPATHSEIYVSKSIVKVQGEPSVKYRGIFLNDEQPALAAWVAEFFPEGKYNSYFVHQFYVKLFELLLRMRANFLWPAMWASMFGEDDPENQYWADYYGIVMSTSHTEPLMRATNEWTTFGNGSWDYSTNKDNIVEFWKEGIARSKPYENMWTTGMRGFGDTPITGGVEISLLEDVIKTQRELLTEYFNNTDITDIPQVWCLYKEVQAYFQEGMQVPEDITLLWVDDNWGNNRRLPLANETDRAGGAGVYYHFDYVGSPVDFKWINTVSLEKTWEQMHLAKQKQADQIWVVNVGDMKPLEIPIEYFISLGYDFDTWGPINKVMTWATAWAQREFGAYLKEDDVKEVADIIDLYGFYANRKKYEALNTTTFHLYNYNEAETVLSEWADLADRAWAVYKKLPKNVQPSFFQLVLHPAVAGYTVYDILISAGKNNLYAEQRRNQANALSTHVLDRFQYDNTWKGEYDSLLGGKWKHMMDQTHLGYFYWQQPMRNVAPPLAYVQLEENSLAGSLGVTVEQSRGSVPGDDAYNAVAYSNNTLVLPTLDPYTDSRHITIFNKGIEDFYFEVSPYADYVKVNPSSGSVSATNNSIWNSVDVEVTVDWDQAPEGYNIVFMNITSNTTYEFFGMPTVNLPINKTQAPDDFKGFVETNQHISIEAEHFSNNQSTNDTYYVTIDRYGRTLSGVTLFPVTADSQEATEDYSYLEYNLYSFSAPQYGSNITVYTGSSLNIDPSRPLKYAIAIDDQEPQVVQIVVDPTDPTAMPAHWEDAASDGVWIHNTTHTFDAGEHTLKLWALEPAVVFEKVVVDFGGVVPSFLGPPETYIKK
ncbi:predicted protein [Scheffersomyces stipitis CBS 6054]|uniref:Gylcosyl hydrolase 115 C-terminal domain-containing protein n=1 Tax=Scheffersomyces stipitis (strain ATCC 58785 / CBS 6054 / NBRC 10063 / NRRL Y-11545) TaxID=322104 RepID=A3LY17_PICST|nr:predicted protein [Scheffersomyces stipitis CBS 6054]ABN67901.2 predicted protein [Scheffersomyces stipitis CBS 6054]